MNPWWTPLASGLEAVQSWQGRWAEIPMHASLRLEPEVVSEALSSLAARLEDNYPFHHPAYAGQMLKPPHPIAQIAYAMAMQINPNNHALDGGPATATMEREVIGLMASMVGYDHEHLGHLTSSGTIANLEALWVARSLHPGRAIAYSSQAHYTHARMCEVLGVEGVAIACDVDGRLDLNDLQSKLASHDIGTVVCTLGTTGLGALDPLHELVTLARSAGLRIHVDAAYGGFYRLLADLDPAPIHAAPYLAMADADSIVIDPHKHGLQPYGCGCVLFKDPSVGRFYQHDSPYTYFTSKELHLGEISLECSRAGAAAAALWTTLRCLPLSADVGLGPALAASRRAALAWASKLEASPYAHLLMPPELDILCFFPLGRGWKASEISSETERVFESLMHHDSEPVYLAKVHLPRALVEARTARVEWDQEHLVALRSVLMKPEHEALVGYLHGRFEHEAWWPEAEAAQPPVRGKALTGPLGLKAEWANTVMRYYDRVRDAVVGELKLLLATPLHPAVARLDIELSAPYGLAGELGVRVLTRDANGETVRAVGDGEARFSGARALLSGVSPIVPGEVLRYERFGPLWEAEEDAQDLAGKHLLAFLNECWSAAGGAACTVEARLGFAGDEEALDLRSGEWIEA